ncbi:MAG: hypothetical protein VYE22_18615 [Myxococcota bacterium]|nr:hypothetical protein [Myxococcota bacterium]
MSDPVARRLAAAALGVALVALVLAGWALHTQQRSEERLREIGQELQRNLTPALPLQGPGPDLDWDDT